MTSLQDYTFEWLASSQIPLANKFYQQHGIRGKAGRHDRCAVLRDLNGDLVASAVLKSKQNYELLTHVGVINELRRCGLASRLIRQMEPAFSNRTYCFPFTYLESLYLSQDFVKVDTSKALSDVVTQYQIYCKQGREILLMQYQTSNDNMI